MDAELKQGWSKRLKQFVSSCLEKSPSQRPSAQQLLSSKLIKRTGSKSLANDHAFQQLVQAFRAKIQREYGTLLAGTQEFLRRVQEREHFEQQAAIRRATNETASLVLVEQSVASCGCCIL